LRSNQGTNRKLLNLLLLGSPRNGEASPIGEVLYSTLLSAMPEATTRFCFSCRQVSSGLGAKSVGSSCLAVSLLAVTTFDAIKSRGIAELYAAECSCRATRTPTDSNSPRRWVPVVSAGISGIILPILPPHRFSGVSRSVWAEAFASAWPPASITSLKSIKGLTSSSSAVSEVERSRFSTLPLH
jgi:hypothetical protein